MLSSPFIMSKRLLDLFLLNPLMCFLPDTLHTRTITHVSGICRITMNVLTFYQTTLFNDCQTTLISYMHTPHHAWLMCYPKTL